MIVLLEGPDGGGKTRLAEYLHDTLGFDVVHHGAETGVSEHAVELYHMSMTAVEDVVLDRCWISDLIYHEYRDGGCNISDDQRAFLEGVAREGGAVLVYCVPPLNDCVSHWRATREEQFLRKRDELFAVHRKYLQRAKDAADGLTTLVWDRTREPLELIQERISKELGL